MMKKILTGCFILGLAAVLSACQTPAEKAAEKTVEKAMEQSIGGQADVDVDDNTVNIQTDEGSFQAGEEVKLPADFPSDVYVYEGTIKAAIVNNRPKGYTITIETDDAPADVKAAYEEKIASDGWTITGTMDFGGTVSLNGEKDSRNLSVIISRSEEDNKTMIILGVAERNE